ncbi:MAG TPA: histidine kinase [Chloroflexota bacterium]|nr:histidine kinase [Chloroflexota bacterium]
MSASPGETTAQSAMSAAPLSDAERADTAGLAQELPALRHQVQELGLLLQQNDMEMESQRLRSESADQALNQLERGGGFSREQYQQLVVQAHQSQLRYLSVQHQQELLHTKREIVQQLVDVVQFALSLAAKLDPTSVEPATLVQPPKPAEAVDAVTQHVGLAAPLPPPSETAIIEAQEEERSWIARQLHNGPAQSLTNLILRAEICERMIGSDTETVRSELHDLRQTIHRTLQDMRRFIFDVRPMILDDLGLLPALRRFVDDWNGQGERNPVTLTVAGQERRIARAKELALFRMVQDAVKMPDGRSGGQATVVQVVMEEQAVRVTIESPVGSQTENAAAPLPAGYHIIQQRGAIVGGATSLETRAGARVLKVVIPLNE